jgi:hypothetical protein
MPALMIRRLSAESFRHNVSDAQVAFFVGCFVALILLLFQQGAVVTSDGASMAAVANSLVTKHSLV